MPRLGVFADVHANLPALEAVLGALEDAAVDAYVCAGDLVGYGPFPNECVERIAELRATVVAGNHDLLALGRLDDRRCGRLVRRVTAWTRAALALRSRALLEDLQLDAAPVAGVRVAHGGIGDPVLYVRTVADARAQLAALPAGETLIVGHTHRPMAVAEVGGLLEPGAESAVVLRPGERHLLNPGAVGQSRSLDTRARALVLDTVAARADLLAVPYDEAATRHALRRAGLPAFATHMPPARFPGEYRLRELIGR